MKRLKRIFLLVLVLAILMSAVPFSAISVSAAEESGTCGDNLTWKLDVSGTLTISGTGAMDHFYRDAPPWHYAADSIKSVVIEEGVISIGWGAFYSCTSLTSVTIPGSLTEIDDCAFERCTSLTSITIPAGVITIGNLAFLECTSLTNITIPDSVTRIEGDAFDGCASLTSITVSKDNPVFHSAGNCLIETESKTLVLGCQSSIIPNDGSVTSIGGYAFSRCTGLTSIIIPDSVTVIGGYAFYRCTGLTSITIPKSVTMIGRSAFEECNGLTNVTIPDSVTEIGWYAFSGCTGLTNITIPNSVAEIDYCAFSGCTNLTSITIPESVTTIGDGAFSGCTGLTSITIPKSVTTIGWRAFSGCTGLTNVTIPDSVTEIDWYAFSGCTGLTNITVSEDNPVFYDEGNCLIATESKTLVLGCQNSIIPNDGSVASIGDSAFSGCTGLTSITIPDSVTEIGWGAFYECTGLTSIVIPNSVTEIGGYGFYRCTSLSSITIPESVTTIGQSAFEECTNLNAINYGGTKEQWKQISIGGYNDCLLSANILFAIVESIEVVSGEIAPLIENLDGSWNERYNEETGKDEEFFCYSPYLGDIEIQINYIDGSSTTAYVGDYVDGYCVTQDSYNDQYDNPWVVGGDNYIIIEYMGVTTQLPVTILSLEDVIGTMPIIQLNETASAVIDTEGQSAYFRFTPEVDGYCVFYSMEDGKDTYGYIYDADMKQLASDDNSGVNGNFKIEYQMVAGKTYILGARYHSSSNTGTFDVCLKKEKKVESIEVVSGEIAPLIENIDGYWSERYSEETGEWKDYFDYSPYLGNVEIQINYTDGSSTTAYVGDYVDGYCVTQNSYYDQYDNPWAVGGDNNITIEYMGATTQLPVTIIENPVESIEVVSAEITLVENANGDWCERYNEETGEEEEFFCYSPDVGDVEIQINYIDGRSTTAYVGEEVDGYWVDYYDDQYDNPWVMSGDNNITIEYMGAITQLPVTIIENPVESIEVVSTEITLAENANGYWRERYNEQTEDYEEFFYYYLPNLEIQINYTDGSSTTAYVGDYVDGYCVTQNSYDDQYDNPWVIGGDNYLTIEYMGAITQLPVKIIENPVESIEVISGGITLAEYANGGWNERYNEETGKDEEFFCYSPDLGDVEIQINYIDGSSTTAYFGEEVDGHWFTWDSYYDQYSNPWVIDGDNNITIEYMGATTQLPVTIIENPVESIEVISGEIVPLMENMNGYWDERYNQEIGEYEEFFRYYVPDSDYEKIEIQINYIDGSSTTAYVGEEVDGYWFTWDSYNDQYSNPWAVGGDNYLTIGYMGVTTQLPVTIIENPVESIEVVSGGFTLVENMGGYWSERYNEETGKYEIFFLYEIPEDGSNIIVQINYLDGTSTTAGIYEEVDGYWIDYCSYYYIDQNNSPWTIGSNNYITIEYLGATTQLPVTIIENPVESIEVISGEFTLMENTNGYWDERYNEETGEYEEFYYYYYSLENVMVQINYTDGSSTTADVGELVNGYWLDCSFDQYSNPWVVGSDNYIIIRYLGATTQLQVTIIENPVESIEVVSGEIAPIVEHINGYWNEWYNAETGEYEEYFYYHFYAYNSSFENVMVQINYTDGSSKVVPAGTHVDNHAMVFIDYQDNNPWTIGGDNYITIEYMGATTQLPVTIIENPVESIEVVSGEITVVENANGSWDERYNEETGKWEEYFRYYYSAYYSSLENVMVQINYTDGSSTTAYVGDIVDGYRVDYYNDQYDNPWVIGGDNYITIEYLEATTLLPVTIIENPVESIRVITPQPIVCYPEEYPILTGMEVEIVYTNGQSQLVTITEENAIYDWDEYSGYHVEVDVDGYILRIEKIWIDEEIYYQASYLGKACEVEVSYADLKIIDITLENVSWNGDGMIVTITYDDGSQNELTLRDFMFLGENGDDGYSYFRAYAKTLNGLVFLEILTYFDFNGEVEEYWIYIFEEGVTIDVVRFEQSGVILETTIDMVDPNTELFVEEQDVGNIIITDNGTYNLDTAVIYDIYLMKDDEIVQPDGLVTISLPVPESLNGELCKVIYVDDFGNITEMNAQFVDGYMVFQTDHFSYYAIVEEKDDTLVGDVNSDGVVNAKDVAALRRYLAGGWDVTIDEAAADTNGDGAINAKDVANLRRYLAGGWGITLG